MNRRMRSHATIAACGLAIACTAAAASPYSEAVKSVATDRGVHLERHPAPIGPVPGGPVTRDVNWTFERPDAIGTSVAISADHVWTSFAEGEAHITLHELWSGEGVERTPLPFGTEMAGLSASPHSERAGFMHSMEGEGYYVGMIDGGNQQPSWTVPHEPHYEYDYATSRSVIVDHDANFLGAMAHYSPEDATVLAFYEDGGGVMSEFHLRGRPVGLDMMEGGEQTIVSIANSAFIVGPWDGEIFLELEGSGEGGFHRMSRDGHHIAIGGYELHVFEGFREQFEHVLEFHGSGNEWFGGGIAISDDSRTLAVASHDVDTYDIIVRMWDLQSRELLGEHTIPHDGLDFQNIVTSAAISAEGEYAVFGLWGVESGSVPEVVIFNREVQLVDSISTPGSVLDVDIMEYDGVVVASGRNGHANTQGEGGFVTAKMIDESEPCIADWNGDGEVDINDFFAYLGDFEAGDPRADLNNDGEIDINDFFIFLQEFEDGC